MVERAITGKVMISEDDGDRIRAVMFISNEGRRYNVVLDAEGELLGLVMDGCLVEVIANVDEKDDGPWLHLVSFEEIDPDLNLADDPLLPDSDPELDDDDDDEEDNEDDDELEDEDHDEDDDEDDEEDEDDDEDDDRW